MNKALGLIPRKKSGGGEQGGGKEGRKLGKGGG
jgi:hypothetical protein